MKIPRRFDIPRRRRFPYGPSASHGDANDRPVTMPATMPATMPTDFYVSPGGSMVAIYDFADTQH
jgi:hypothetical protein